MYGGGHIIRKNFDNNKHKSAQLMNTGRFRLIICQGSYPVHLLLCYVINDLNVQNG